MAREIIRLQAISQYGLYKSQTRGRLLPRRPGPRRGRRTDGEIRRPRIIMPPSPGARERGVPRSLQSKCCQCCKADTPPASLPTVSRSRPTTRAGGGDYSMEARSRRGLELAGLKAEARTGPQGGIVRRLVRVSG